ncbi:hypothetical protein [Flavimaricola marinus]|uniref:DUF4382 domain-containing protein n=1 Tax=Flavimaricola marinus TaxID=1819565 RepID=A0A238LIN8_9RHOB|nr:hypothetical protein [Flavimaricola marinus]SMY09511.1 hypothetical protein LOM8899_03678 [Flavimaricola marinus]
MSRVLGLSLGFGSIALVAGCTSGAGLAGDPGAIAVAQDLNPVLSVLSDDTIKDLTQDQVPSGFANYGGGVLILGEVLGPLDAPQTTGVSGSLNATVTFDDAQTDVTIGDLSYFQLTSEASQDQTLSQIDGSDVTLVSPVQGGFSGSGDVQLVPDDDEVPTFDLNGSMTGTNLAGDVFNVSGPVTVTAAIGAEPSGDTVFVLLGGSELDSPHTATINGAPSDPFLALIGVGTE